MTEYYTSVNIYGNHILYRGFKNGRRIKTKVPYAPTLFVPSNKKTGWKSLDDVMLEPMKFDTIKEARNFVERYKDVDNFTIYGNNQFQYAFIAENFPGVVEWDYTQVAIDVIDIEVGSENGFPDPYIASEPITAICITRVNGGTTVFGCGEYKTVGSENYIQCRDEYTLCKRFIEHWEHNCPDVVTGWYIKFFDIPYLVNRLKRILGDEYAKKLSPWSVMYDRKTFIKGKEQTNYQLEGLAVLDYVELYRWYAPNGKSQSSNRLDIVANFEIGERKLSYDEYDNLNQLYKQNYQKFIEYNIKDVALVIKIDDKLKLLELALTLAYDTKTNYEDVFAQTRMWDSLTYNYLIEKGIVIPPKVIKSKTEAFEGAYVKEPKTGMHYWIASFDLNSLYPHLMMQYNISPEMLVEPENYTDEMRQIISQGVSVEKLLAMKIDTSSLKGVCLTPNGQFFRTDKTGFLPEMLESMYEDRKKFKKLMINVMKEYEVETDPEKRYELEKQIARYNNLQLAKKVNLNSAYGALGSQYFRFYDLRMATAVTAAGQLSIRWIENKVNNYMNKLLKTEDDYVIASDTDSIYLCLDKLVNKVFTETKDTNKVISFMDKICEDKLQPYINTSYEELAAYVHAHQQKMQMKREGLSDKGIWTAKKRYILNVHNNEGVQYKEPHIKVMGLEMVKSSTPDIIRGKMSELVKLIMNNTEEDVQEFIAKFKKEFLSLPPEDVSFPRGVNGIAEYSDSATLYRKGTPIHVRGAILYNHMIKQLKLMNKYQLIQEGEKLKFTYLKTPNPLKETVISFPNSLPVEFGVHEYVDYETQFDKTFIEPIKLILDCINWKTEKENSLEDFFT